MRSTTTRLIIAIVSIVLLTDSPHAQTAGGGGRRQHQQKADKPAAQTPKADDKAYNAALKSLPDKKYDPWHAAR
jgi:hypothetical protein